MDAGTRATAAQRYAEQYLSTVRDGVDALRKDFTPTLVKLVEILYDARSRGAQVFLVGNGGSASTASHMMTDLAKGSTVEGFPRLRVWALTDNIPQMTAIGNDISYADIFIEQLKNYLRKDDVLVALSGSGNSPNILKAIEYANAQGALTVGLTGRYKGKVGKLAEMAKVPLVVPVEMMQQIEDLHLIIQHLLCMTLVHVSSPPPGRSP